MILDADTRTRCMDYLDLMIYLEKTLFLGQLTLLILKNTFILLESYRVLQHKNITIQITQKTYDALYADLDDSKRLETLKKHLKKWIRCNDMEQILTLDLQEKSIIITINYPSMIKEK